MIIGREIGLSDPPGCSIFRFSVSTVKDLVSAVRSDLQMICSAGGRRTCVSETYKILSIWWNEKRGAWYCTLEDIIITAAEGSKFVTSAHESLLYWRPWIRKPACCFTLHVTLYYKLGVIHISDIISALREIAIDTLNMFWGCSKLSPQSGDMGTISTLRCHRFLYKWDMLTWSNVESLSYWNCIGFSYDIISFRPKNPSPHLASLHPLTVLDIYMVFK